MGKGKRNSTIVISSSDDDEVKEKDLSLKSGFGFSKSAPTGKNPKRAKRATRVSLSTSCSSPFQHSSASGFDEVHFNICFSFVHMYNIYGSSALISMK